MSIGCIATAMKRNSDNRQENDLPGLPGRLKKIQKLANSVDPSLVLSYDRRRLASPVQWSNFKHIVVL